MTAKRRRKRRTQVNRRIAPVLAALVLIVLIAAALFISYLIDKYSPSKERMAWTEYYSVSEADGAQGQDDRRRGLCDHGHAV